MEKENLSIKLNDKGNIYEIEVKKEEGHYILPLSRKDLKNLKSLINAIHDEPIGYQIYRHAKTINCLKLVNLIEELPVIETIYKTPKIALSYLNTYGVLIGLSDKDDIRILPLYEGEIKNPIIVDVEPEKQCSEFCPYCENEVTLHNRFIPQICPQCGRLILPCNMCVHCGDCPFDCADKRTIQRHYFMEWVLIPKPNNEYDAIFLPKYQGE